ncbi:MAG: EpsG family protein [Christensenellales bacterium]
MGPYYFLVAIPVLYHLLSPHHIYAVSPQARTRRTVLIFFAIYIFLLLLRDSGVGVDLVIYLPRFRLIGNTSWPFLFLGHSNSEPAYIILNKVISIFYQNDQFFLAVVSLIITLPVAYLYAKESEGAILTISIFLVFPLFEMFFSGLRQSIAIALAVPAYYFVKNKRPVYFVLTVILAYLFHNSALIMLMLYPVYHVRVTRLRLIIVVPIIILIYIFNSTIFDFLLGFLGGHRFEKYRTMSSTGAYTMLILLALFAAFSFFIVDDKKLCAETVGLRNILLFSTCLQIFAPLHPLAMRMNYYFLLFPPILIPMVINRSRRKYHQIAIIAKVVISLFFIFYFFFHGYNGDDVLQVYPYKAFWEVY